MQTIKISYRGDTALLTCNLSEASAPLVINGIETGYQTADARHKAHVAVALVCRLVWPDVEWPEVPATGPVYTVNWDECDAWCEMRYEVLGWLHELWRP